MRVIIIYHMIFIFKITHFIFYLSHVLNKEKIFLFPFMENTFLDCKQNVDAGINTLMSISDGLGTSIFCRKMYKARPMREKMDGKVGYFPPESASFTLML